MKKITTLLLTLVLAATVMGQHKNDPSRQHKEPPKVEEMVSDLSAIQKKKLNTIMENSRKEVDRLQAELDRVRKQINALINKEGDNSDQIFPLFDREGVLRAEISKEMYRTRQQIDNILTKEQLAEMRARLAKDCKKNSPKDKAATPAAASDHSSAPADKPRNARRR